MIPRYLTVEYGSDVEILCNATGHPDPQISWQKLGTVISTKEPIEEGTLLLRSATEKDSGLYTCHARNSVGHETKNVLIIVKGRKSFYVWLIGEGEGVKWCI